MPIGKRIGVHLCDAPKERTPDCIDGTIGGSSFAEK